MTAKLTALIDRPDNVEIIRDKIAEILLVESAKQQELAIAAGKDPALWKLRVFTERSNPWDEYVGPPPKGEEIDPTPLVNVRWSESTDDAKASNSVDRQKVEGTFLLECYGYGIGVDTDDGHQPGDELAALEAQRAARLVRSILMAGPYTYLDMRGVVWRRWRSGAKAFELPAVLDQRPAQHVQGVCVSMRVDFNEFSPQVDGTPLALITVTCVRADNGELTIFEASYTESP